MIPDSCDGGVSQPPKGLGDHALPRAFRHAPSRGGLKKYGRRLVNKLHVGREAHPTTLEASALPETKIAQTPFAAAARSRFNHTRAMPFMRVRM